MIKNLFIVALSSFLVMFIFKWMATEVEIVQSHNSIRSYTYRADSIAFSNKNLEVLLEEKNKDIEILKCRIRDKEREISFIGRKLQEATSLTADTQK
jgi:hypothetical protein